MVFPKIRTWAIFLPSTYSIILYYAQLIFVPLLRNNIPWYSGVITNERTTIPSASLICEIRFNHYRPTHNPTHMYFRAGDATNMILPLRLLFQHGFDVTS